MYVCINLYMCIYNKLRRKYSCQLTVLISVTGYMVVPVIYNYLHPLSILDSFCLQQAPQLVVVL